MKCAIRYESCIVPGLALSVRLIAHQVTHLAAPGNNVETSIPDIVERIGRTIQAKVIVSY